MSNEREFFSPTTLAEYLDVPLPTIYQWRYQGKGPAAIKVGRHVRYRRQDVERWLASQTDSAGA